MQSEGNLSSYVQNYSSLSTDVQSVETILKKKFNKKIKVYTTRSQKFEWIYNKIFSDWLLLLQSV